MPGEGNPVIRSELTGGDVAVDVGANPKGDDVAGLMCECVESDGLVIAFDPFPIEGFHELETEYENVVCISEAVTSDRVSMAETKGNVGSSTEEHQDRTYEGGVSLDIVAYADFVKVDVEGYEFDVLRSGTRLLRRHQPALLIEVHKWKEKENGWTRSMVSFLHNLDYDIHSVTKERRVTSADDLRDTSADKIFCTPQIRTQKELIHDCEWDWLLVLDGCRYDAFEALYETYLDGELCKVRSLGDKPLKWVSEMWPDTYDITYVSAQPNINSDGIKGTELPREGARDIAATDPNHRSVDQFEEIVDVSDVGSDEAIESVHPEAVNDALREADPPCIGHYTQPQFPWDRGGQWAESRDVEIPDNPRMDMDYRESTREPRFSRRRVKRHLGEEGVKYAYKDNLEFVLDHVSNLVADLHGTVVITADRGESMPGPDAHPARRAGYVLEVVPWLEVK